MKKINDLQSYLTRLRGLMLTLIILCSIGVGNVWGGKITLTQSSLDLIGSYTSGAEKTVDGVTFVSTDLMKNNSNIQAKASTGVIYNKTAMPGNITEIKVTHSGTARSTTVYYGTTAQPTTNSNTFSGSKTISVSGSNKYFKITRGSKAAYWTSIEITYADAVAYTITATRNIDSYGTVEVSGTTITATPAAGYRVMAGNDGYTVTSGSATVVNNGDNTFTVTPSSDCTVQINFEADQQYTVNWYVNGSIAHSQTGYEGATLTGIPTPTSSDCDGSKVFVGWYTSTYSHASTAPAYVSPTTIPNGGANYYAVFATASGGGGSPTAYTAGDEGTYVLAIYVSDTWYALPATPTVNNGKISGEKITVSNTGGVDYVTSANASGYEWTIANATNGQTISDGSKYIYHSNGGASGTDLTYGTSTSYTWTIESETKGLTFKGTNGSTVNSRGLLASGTTFGGYSLSNEDASGYYRIHVLPIGGGTTYSAYSTSCAACANNVTVNYTAAPAGGSVAVTNGGAAVAAGSTVKTCTGGASLVVTVTPSTHYSVSSVTFTPSAGLGAGDLSGTSTPASTTAGVWTYNVTIAEDAAGTLTIAPTFTEDAHVAINWNVNGSNLDLSGSAAQGLTWVYSGGDITALPSTPANNTLDACIGSGKGRFMGWSPTKVMPAQDVVPEGMFNEVEYAPEITDDVTFYAVFAEEKAGSFAATNKTYTFTSKAWADDESAWTGSKNGNSKTNQGVQICTSQSGVTVTSKSSYDDVTKVTVTYSTNAKAGAGSISIKVNSTAYTESASVSSTDGTSDRTIDFTPPSSALDGAVKITVTCTDNSIYIKSVQIFYTGSTTTYSGYRTACCVDPQLTFGTIASPVTEYVIVREDLASASAGVEINCNFESNNTSEDITWYSTHRDKNDYVGAYTWTSSQPTDRLEITNKKIIAKETGSWQITIAQAMGSTNYCDETATVNIIVKTVDKFIDNVNGNFSGEAQRLEDTGNGIVLPTAETFSTDNGCADGTTRRLLGWIKASDLATYASGRRVDMIDNLKTSDPATNKVKAPGTKVQATGVTWYAVWGVEK